MADKFSKSSVDYSAGKPSAHCGICAHYRESAGIGSCTIVAGPIDASYWCQRFLKREGFSQTARNIATRTAAR